MHVLGVIPARGGSKGMVGKNLVPLAGRPLLAWTADAAQASRTLTRVVLSTDDDEIARVGRACGLDVPFLRDPSLARDDTPIVAVLTDLMTRLHAPGDGPDVLVLLQPTSPLRTAADVDAAVSRLAADAEIDTVVSVVEVPHQYTPASLMADVDGRLAPWLGGPVVTRRQDKPTLYARNGPAVVALRPAVLASGTLYGPVTAAHVMPPERSIDIDGPWDLALAEFVLERQRR